MRNNRQQDSVMVCDENNAVKISLVGYNEKRGEIQKSAKPKLELGSFAGDRGVELSAVMNKVVGRRQKRS